MDVIIEIFLEFFCEVYFDLLENLLPNKNIGKKTKIFLKILCLLVSIGVIICAVFGLIILTDKKNREENLLEGIIFISVAAIVLSVNFAIMIYNYKKKSDKKTIDEYIKEKEEEKEDSNLK